MPKPQQFLESQTSSHLCLREDCKLFRVAGWFLPDHLATCPLGFILKLGGQVHLFLDATLIASKREVSRDCREVAQGKKRTLGSLIVVWMPQLELQGLRAAKLCFLIVLFLSCVFHAHCGQKGKNGPWEMEKNRLLKFTKCHHLFQSIVRHYLREGE